MNDLEWKEIDPENMPSFEKMGTYLLWWDKNPVYEKHKITEYPLEDNPISPEQIYDEIPTEIKEWDRKLYYKVDVEADSQMDLVKISGEVKT